MATSQSETALKTIPVSGFSIRARASSGNRSGAPAAQSSNVRVENENRGIAVHASCALVRAYMR